jgi:hypothetical protein
MTARTRVTRRIAERPAAGLHHGTPIKVVLVLVLSAAAIFYGGHTELGIIVMAAVIATYAFGYLTMRMGVNHSLAVIRAGIEHVERVKAARSIYRQERAVYLKLVFRMGETAPETKAAVASMENAFKSVEELDEQFANNLREKIEFHAELVDRMGSSSDREVVATLAKKLSALAADGCAP